jgi:hypothetical protein
MSRLLVRRARWDSKINNPVMRRLTTERTAPERGTTPIVRFDYDYDYDQATLGFETDLVDRIGIVIGFTI